MSWLFARQLRPFVVLAGAASLVLNLALLAPALYMLQVFDRVFASRSVETLVMLTLLAALALGLAYFMDTVRAGALSWAGRALDRRLAPAALESVLRDAAAPSGRPDSDVLRDIGQLRSFLSGSGVHAFFDAPWVPIYVLVIGLMHPVLGLTATIGACLLAAIALATEKLTHEPVRQVMAGSRASTRHAEALARNAEVIVGMGMTAAAVSAWQAGQEKLLEAQAGAGGTTARLSALARVARQLLQVAMLGVGAWLVIGTSTPPRHHGRRHHPPRARLAPLESLDRRMEGMVDARAAWQRLGSRRGAGASETRAAGAERAASVERMRVRRGAARPADQAGQLFA